ncbi:Exosome complex component RRP45, partial [Stegodyphus mimosarum]
MKITSICERDFVVNCATRKSKRLDGRDLSQGRNLEITFGQERGCCLVMQGNTRVLAQVSCEVTEPKPATPTEGALYINLEFSAMASPEAKSQMRTSDEAVEYQRSLERC